MRGRSLCVAVFALLAACGSNNDGQYAESARSELRRARFVAMLAPRSTKALVRLGRAKLQVWDEDGAEEAFQKAYRIDEKVDDAVGTAYYNVARAFADRGPLAVAHNPLIARYVQNASRWSQRPTARQWYLERIAHVLPQVDPAKRIEVIRVAQNVDGRRGAAELHEYVGKELSAAWESDNAARTFALIGIIDLTTDRSSSENRVWLAKNYAQLAKRVGSDDADITQRCITRAQELDARWTSDYELLNLRSRLPNGKGELSDMQKTANQMIQIVVAATKHSRERGQFPPCDSISSFIVAIAPYSDVPLSSADVWGNAFECYVPNHGLYLVIRSAGPDRQQGRGEEISAWEAMHITEQRDQADLSIEHGYYAPPWWSKESVLALYR